MGKLYDSAKAATLKEIRALKTGDVLECYYQYGEAPVLEVITCTLGTSKTRTEYDLVTTPLDVFCNGKKASRSLLITHRFKKVGRVKIEFVRD